MSNTARLPMSPLRRDTAIDHFRTIRLIGRGGMGEVYLARDTKLGRKVALKLINPEQIGERDAVERFLFEARATAVFNHPNIVTIYAAGEHEGRPYVALEYVEGQSLGQRLEQGPPSRAEALRIGVAIGRALVEAHRHNLLHRDLKPDNVLISEEGVVRVADFGLAKVIDPGQWSGSSQAPLAPVVVAAAGPEATTIDEPFATGNKGWRGTPPYMAPEQWRGETGSGATDVWALGLILYEMISGRRPYDDVSRGELAARVTGPDPVPLLARHQELPAPLADLIHACLAKESDERPSAAEVVERLEALIDQRGRVVGDDHPVPFPGLLPFDERLAGFFFGRDAEVDALVERVRRDGVLPVVGPSGVGKSSLLHAGVIPRLRDQGPWIVIRLRAGRDPLTALAERVAALEAAIERDLGSRTTVAAHLKGRGARAREDGGEEEPLQVRLQRTPLALGVVLRRLAQAAGSRVLLAVDQLEEVFTRAPEAQGGRFVEALCSAADDDPDDPVRVIFTLRDDFLVRLAESPAAGAALRNLTVLRSPEPEALRAAVLGPLERLGHSFDDPALVDEMVAAVRQERASLPLLQFAMRVLWDARDRERRLLRRASYEAAGGVGGALANHADGVLASFSADERRLARELLLRLVSSEGTRRLLPASRLLQGLGQGADEVLERLGQARLVISAGGSVDDADETEVELIHGSLIDGWRTLARWIDESRHELALLEQLEQTADLWRRRGCNAEETWQGRPLVEARRAIDHHQERLSPLVEQFVATGEVRQHRRLRRRQLVGWAAVLTLVLVTAGSLIFAWALSEKEERARQQQRLAERQRAMALRQAARSALDRGQGLEARAELRLSLEVEDSAAGRALWRRALRDPRIWLQRLPASAHDVALTPPGAPEGRVAVACQDRSIYIYRSTGELERTLSGHGDQVLTVAFGAKGQRLAAGTRSGEVWLWDLRRATRKLLSGHEGPVRRVVFSPDGRLLASASRDATIRIWQVDGRAPPRVLSGHADRVYDAAFSPDGKQLVSGSYDRTVRIWSLGDGASRVVGRHADRIFAVAFNPDGDEVASGGWDRVVRVWNASSGELVRALSGHTDGVSALSFSPDGRVLVSGSADKTVRLWAAKTGRSLGVLRGHRAGISRLTVDGAGPKIASASFDKTVRLWRLAGQADEGWPSGHADRVNGVAFAPDGRTIASASSDQTVGLWNARSGEQAQRLVGHDNGVIAVTFSPDGQLLASSSWDNSIRIWDLDLGSERQVLLGHEGEVRGIVFTSDGKQLISASWDRTIRLWDVDRGAQLAVLRGHGAGVRSVALDPSGRWLASAGGDQTIRIWDLARRRVRWTLVGHESTVTVVAFSPDGEQLASGGYDRTVRLWTLADRRGRVLGRHQGRVYQLAFRPGTREVASVGADGVVRYWGPSGEPRELLGHEGTVNDLAFSPDGRLLATAGDDATVRLWALPEGQPVWSLRAALFDPPRIRTHRGWAWGRGGPGWIEGLVGESRLLEGLANTVCRIDRGGRLQLTAAGRTMLDEPVAGGGRIFPVADGCAVLADGRLRLYRPGGWFEDLHGGVVAAGTAGSRLLAATKSEVLVFDGQGRLRGRRPVQGEVTALAGRGSRWLALGFADGRLQRIRLGQGRPVVGQPFGGASASRVTRIVAGPRRTLIAGHASGAVGVWQPGRGALLQQHQLHGPVRYLAVDAGKVYAASELGDQARIDLGWLEEAYCVLLRKIWREVPVIWRHGVAVRHDPPAEHRCSARADGS